MEVFAVWSGLPEGDIGLSAFPEQLVRMRKKNAQNNFAIKSLEVIENPFLK